MIKLKSLLPVVIVAAGVAGTQAAHAHDGTITFTGQIRGGSCAISGGAGGSPNFTVSLPEVSTKSLSTAGQTAGSTPFSIVLKDCNPADGTVQALFELDTKNPNLDQETKNLKVDAGGAENVQIRLLNAEAKQIVLGADINSQNSPQAKLNQGGATLNYYAQYFATGAVKPGTVNASVTYTIIYH